MEIIRILNNYALSVNPLAGYSIKLSLRDSLVSIIGFLLPRYRLIVVSQTMADK